MKKLLSKSFQIILLAGTLIAALALMSSCGHVHTSVTDKGYSATCTKDGLTDGKHCEGCGEILLEQKVIPATGHSPETISAIESTCTAEGKTEGEKCKKCGAVLKEQTPIAKKEHKPESVEALSPTCEFDGHTEGVRCSYCDEALEGIEPIEKLGHIWAFPEFIWTDFAAEAFFTCEIDGTHTKKITADIKSEIKTEPTEDSTGLRVYTASVTENGVTYTDTREEVIGFVCEHIWTLSAWRWDDDFLKAHADFVCTKDASHKETATVITNKVVIISSTCTREGETEYTATVTKDGVEYSEKLLQRTETTPHSVVEIKRVEPTCIDVGYTAGERCAECNLILKEPEQIPPTGEHTIKKVDGNPATCTEDGLTDGAYCTFCNTVIKEQDAISALGHNPLNAEKQEPTCEEAGREAGILCSRCNQIVNGCEEIAPLGHDYTVFSRFIWDGYGKAELELKCTRNGFHASYYNAQIEKNTRTEPTCSDDGVMEYTASVTVDGKLYTDIKTQVVNKVSHEYVSIPGKSATCTEDGLTEGYGCKYCGKMVFDQEVIPAHHIFDENNICTACGASRMPTVGLYYTLVDGTYTVSGIGNATDMEIVIPETHEGLPVTKIANGAFKNKYNITALFITGSITEIGSEAFYGCESLEKVIISGGVSKIGTEAFRRCTALKTVILPESLKILDRSVFYGCSLISNLSIPIGVEEIGVSCFEGCTGLIRTESGISYVDGWAVASEKSIKSLALRNDTRAIANEAFKDCTSITEIILSDNITVMGDKAFSGCTAAEKLVLPNGLKIISSHAFSGCEKLKSVTFPQSVVSSEYNAFEDCNNITEVHITDLTAWIKTEFSVSSNPASIATRLYLNGKPVTEVTVPSGITKIGDYAFYCLKDITSVRLSDSVKKIGDYSFAGITGNIFLYLGNGLEEIESYAFYGDTGLRTAVLPQSLKSIGERAFMYCESIESIEFPQKLEFIGPQAFSTCTSLASIVIPDSVTKIDEGAFDACSSLKSITLGTGITSISYAAFSGCSSLESVVFKGKITSIGALAFANCTSLTEFTIPESVTMIKTSAFTDCSSLKNAYFEVTNGWYYSKSAGYQTTLSMSDPQYAAWVLTEGPNLYYIIRR